MLKSSDKRSLPIKACLPSIKACTPLPEIAVKFLATAGVIFLSFASLITAKANGCSDESSSPAAIRRISFSLILPIEIISVTCGLPTVIVPVLSMTTVFISWVASRTSAFLVLLQSFPKNLF